MRLVWLCLNTGSASPIAPKTHSLAFDGTSMDLARNGPLLCKML